MAETFLLEIVTTERGLISDQVEEMVAPGAQGEFGVLSGHTPFLTTLKPGELKFRVGREVRYLAVSGGFAEVDRTKVTVLAEAAERAEEIDPARAEAAQQRAQSRIKAHPNEGIDLDRARASLERAAARLQVARRVR